MKTLFEGIMKSPSMKKITALSEHHGQTLVYDVSDSAKRVAAAALYTMFQRSFVVRGSLHPRAGTILPLNIVPQEWLFRQ